MEEVLLKATRRNVIGKQVKALRRAGQLPGVLYGRGIEPLPVVFDLREANRVLSHVASSTLVSIELDGEKHMALVRERQRDFIKGSLKHIDFQVVSMREKLRVPVAIALFGESPAVKDFNGVPVTGVEELDVECLPQDLPQQIRVDISVLKKIGDGIYVRDIVPPPNVEILDDPNEMVVLVTSPAVEEEVEVAPAVEAPEGGEPEVIEKGKKEEEEF